LAHCGAGRVPRPLSVQWSAHRYLLSGSRLRRRAGCLRGARRRGRHDRGLRRERRRFACQAGEHLNTRAGCPGHPMPPSRGLRRSCRRGGRRVGRSPRCGGCWSASPRRQGAGTEDDKDNQRADWDAWLVLARKLRPDPDDGEGRDGVPDGKGGRLVIYAVGGNVMRLPTICVAA
jgi:hypothetical protein